MPAVYILNFIEEKIFHVYTIYDVKCFQYIVQVLNGKFRQTVVVKIGIAVVQLLFFNAMWHMVDLPLRLTPITTCANLLPNSNCFASERST